MSSSAFLRLAAAKTVTSAAIAAGAVSSAATGETDERLSSCAYASFEHAGSSRIDCMPSQEPGDAA